MNIFEIIISPFLFIIKKLFMLFYDITNNYGVSIVLLSLGISVILLPVFIIIEKAKKKDDALKLKMKPLVDEIKRCYKGQERYYYLKTLHRQHNYSPIRALIPILSLLLQIPFFIAAYQFLEGLEPLAGVSFLFIKDLNAPDGLLGTINILPIAMTLVNLVAAYFYTRNGNVNERKQMLVVAGIFLVLLFKLPSGLVLYWTMNNVFSFFRLFITNPEVFKKVKKQNRDSVFTNAEIKARLKPLFPKLKVTFIVLLVLGILSQLNWAFSNNFNGILIRIISAVIGSLALTMCIAFLVVFNRSDPAFKLNDLKFSAIQIWLGYRITFYVIFALAILSQVNWALHNHFNDLPGRIFFSGVGSFILTYFIATIVFVYRRKSGLNKRNFSLSSFGRMYVFAFIFISLFVIALQINWGLHFNFDDIILRVLLSVVVSWVFIYLTARIAKSINWGNATIKSILQSIFQQVKILKGLYLTLLLLSIFSQINWVLKNNGGDLVVRILGAIAGSSLLILLIAIIIPVFRKLKNFIINLYLPIRYLVLMFVLLLYYYYAARFYFGGYNTLMGVIAFIFLISTQLVAINIFAKQRTESSSILFNLTSIFLTLIFITQVIQLYVVITGDDISFSLLNQALSIKEATILDVISGGILFSSVPLLISLWNSIRSFSTKLTDKHWLIYLLSIFYIIGLVFLWHPIIVYSSSPESFAFSAATLLKTNVKLFSIVLGSFTLLYLILPDKIKKVLLIFSLTTTAIAFFNVFIFPIDMGTLQMHRFSEVENLAVENSMLIFESVFILGIVVLINYLIKKNYSIQIILVLILLNLIPVAQSIILTSNYDNNASSHIISDIPSSEGSASISFSKDGENVVIIMADMFQGWYIKNILEAKPSLKESFSGFVWYPNTISVSNYTAGSMPAILAGFNHTPDQLDKDTTKTLAEKTQYANELLRDRVKADGYCFTSKKVPYSPMDISTIDTYLPLWHKDWDHYKGKLNIGVTKNHSILWQNTVFFCVPSFVKPRIYNNGSWFTGKHESNENSELTKPYNFMRILPYISDTNNIKPNFTLICTKASHFPWDIVDDDGMLIQNRTPFKNNLWTLEKIAGWLEWMKQNKVYDNTKIILVSDHGIRDTEINDTIMIDNPFIPKVSEDIPLKELLYYTPLLMVKDFNTSGPVKEDWRFMSNADVPDIALDKTSLTNMEIPESRTLKAFKISWRIKVFKDVTYPIDKTYIVKDNVYEVKNWTIIENN